MKNKSQSSKSEYPSGSTAWALVILLTISYIFSFYDRYILGLLIEPIKADLKLSDEQIGLVLGPAFAIFYATMGLPVGWLVDRGRRSWIISAGISFWTLATVACGLAKNFGQLFIARMAVGVGEATLNPSAMSMISDSFPPERRGKPISVYVAALSLGAGLASLIGGLILKWANSQDTIQFLGFTDISPWQLAFFASAPPGILLAIIFFFWKEPKRIAETGMEQETGGSFAEAFLYLKQNFGTYIGFISLSCVMSIIAYSQGFLAPVFERSWGWSTEKYAFTNAVILLISGPAAVILSGIITDKLTQSGHQDSTIKILMISFLGVAITAVLMMFMPNGELAFSMIFLNTASMAVMSAMGPASVLVLAPSHIKGQLIAFYYIVTSLTGLFLGPMSAGILSTRVFGEENIRYALAAIPLIYGIIPLIFMPISYRKYCCLLSKQSEATSTTSAVANTN